MNYSEMNSSSDLNSSQAPGSQASEDMFYVPEPEVSRIIRYVVYAILFVAAICGNVTVCIIPLRHKRMRTCTYFLITNLAVSDIGTMLCLPYILIMEWQHGSWSMGAVMCKLVNPSLTMFYLVTTNTLVAIAVNRFLVLVYPFRSKFGKTKVALIILLTWLVAFLCVLPSVGARQLVPLPTGEPGEIAYYCYEIFPGDTLEKGVYYQNIYTIFQYTINIALPIVLIVILYIAIAYNLRKMAISLGRGSLTKEKTQNVTNTSQGSLPRNQKRKKSIDDFSAKKRNELERKFLRMLAVVVLIFVVCYVPYCTLFLIIAYQEEVLHWKYLRIAYHYIYLLMWFPNAVNPICYGALDEHYSNAIRALLRCTSKSQRYLKERLGSISQAGTTNGHKRHGVVNQTSTMPRILEESATLSGEGSYSHEKDINSKKRWKIVCS